VPLNAVIPNSIVMNGGLSFAGEEGDRRSREFLKLFDKSTLDAIAYHAHGPGSVSERRMFETVRAEATKWGKGDMTLVQTESGVAGSTPAQIRMQARTAIQKMAYAQSVGVPMFQWFRLFIDGGDAGYSNTLNPREPRPVVLSYRTMTKNLKGLKYARTLNVNASDAEAYIFADNRGGNRRALVLWTNGQGGATRTLNLGSGAQNVALLDMFGNALPVVKGNVVTVPLDSDPVFLTWSGGDAQQVMTLPSLLQVPALAYVTPGGSDKIAVTVKNPTDAPLTSTLVLSAGAQSLVKPVGAAQNGLPVNIPAGGEQRFEIPVQVASKSERVTWPRQWTVFTGLPADTLKAADVAQIPAQLTVGGKTIAPQTASLRDLMINLAPLGGGVGEKKEALLMAEVFMPEARTVQFGASADWWMEWFVNGQRVYSTIPAGNQGGYSVLDHVFNVPLKAGRNVLAVRVLSGSQGWKIMMGGPDQVSEARGAGDATRQVAVLLKNGDATLARERLNLSPRVVVTPLGSGQSASFAPWSNLVPDAEVGEDVVNEWAKQPDSKRWWQGDADLSGRVWLRADANRLQVVLAVRDDVNRPAPDASAIDSSDAVRVALSTQDRKALQIGACRVERKCSSAVRTAHGSR
jgi:hypothetical protein